jgi:hypothetical protein
VAGADIDWAAYQAGRGHRRVLLPPTPFERQRYWVDPTPARDHLIYTARWEQAPAVPATGAADPVLVLGTAAHGVDRVKVAFRSAGRIVVDDLAQVSGPRVTVCDLTGIAPDAADGASALDSALTLARTLAASRAQATMIFVVNRLLDAGSGAIEPRRALITGASLVIPQEYPGLRCRIVDIDAAGTLSNGWLDALVAEAGADETASIVAWRSDELLSAVSRVR